MRWLIALAATFAFAVPATAEEAAPAASELTALLKSFLDGASRNEIAAHERFWADDLVYTSSAGARTDKAEILASLRETPDTP